MSAQGSYRFYSVYRQTILLVTGEPLGRERVKNVKNYVPIKNEFKPSTQLEKTFLVVTSP